MPSRIDSALSLARYYIFGGSGVPELQASISLVKIKSSLNQQVNQLLSTIINFSSFGKRKNQSTQHQ